MYLSTAEPVVPAVQVMMSSSDSFLREGGKEGEGGGGAATCSCSGRSLCSGSLERASEARSPGSTHLPHACVHPTTSNPASAASYRHTQDSKHGSAPSRDGRWTKWASGELNSAFVVWSVWTVYRVDPSQKQSEGMTHCAISSRSALLMLSLS